MHLLTLLTPLLLFLVASCATTQGNADDARARRAIRSAQGTNTVAVDAAETGVDLSSYLRRIAGVSVRGSGPEATVRIRGDNNFSTDATPLFVINGTVIGNNYSQVYDTIDINEIARVTVLKNVTDTNRYGYQGANGVIEIKLR